MFWDGKKNIKWVSAHYKYRRYFSQKLLVLRKSKIKNRDVPLKAYKPLSSGKSKLTAQRCLSAAPAQFWCQNSAGLHKTITKLFYTESQCGPEEMLWSPTWSPQPLQPSHHSNNINDIGTVLTNQWFCESDIRVVEKAALICWKIYYFSSLCSYHNIDYKINYNPI